MEKRHELEKPPSRAATHQLRLRFFDLEAEIRSDSRTFVDLFARMYRRFRADASPSPPETRAQFLLLTRADSRLGVPVMVLDGEVVPLRDPRLLEGYAYERVLASIVARVRSHFLVHASVASQNDQGIILSADSSHGKTTLVLELVRRGFRFLSDEMAALGRADHLVHPFPRCLRIRPGTLELAGFPAADRGAPMWLGKLLLDVEEIRPHSLGGPVAISQVIILRDPAEDEDIKPDASGRRLEIQVDHLDQDFLTEVRRIAGVRDVQVHCDGGYPLVRLRAARRTFALSRIEALCRARQMVILDVIKRVEGQPVFDSPARLEPIPRSQAVMQLLRRFQGGHQSALLQDELRGSATRLFLELADVVGQARCRQLFVGPLQQMADLVCSLVESPACSSEEADAR